MLCNIKYHHNATYNEMETVLTSCCNSAMYLYTAVPQKYKKHVSVNVFWLV